MGVVEHLIGIISRLQSYRSICILRIHEMETTGICLKMELADSLHKPIIISELKMSRTLNPVLNF